MRRTVTLSIAFAVLAVPAAARADAGDIVVRRDPGLDRAGRLALRQRADVRLVAALPLASTELVSPHGGQAAALAALRRDPDVVYAVPDARVHLLATNDQYSGLQWDLDNIGQADFDGQPGIAGADVSAAEAWALSRGAGVTVGVVDTGVDASQPDLAGQIDASLGRDWIDQDQVPQDDHGHGTHVAGTIAALADNTIGVAGLAPAAKIAALRVFDGNGEGSTSDVASAFAYAGSIGLRVVNASLGGGYSQPIADAIAAYPNTLFVVAAGNDGLDDDGPHAEYPCALNFANVICVGASDNRDAAANWSNFGRTTVDLFAPGVDIVSTVPGDYEAWSGTSMAAPHVAAVAALALAADPAATAWQLRAALLHTVDHPAPLAGLSVTGGRVNAAAAVADVGREPAGPPSTPPPVSPPPSAPSAPVTSISTAVTRVRVSGTLRARRKRSRLRVSFALTGSGSVRFLVTRAGSGRALTSWRQTGVAGSNVVTLARRLPSRKTLARGRYELVLTLGNSAKAARFDVR